MTLAQLLVVQAHDSAIDRLTHQRTVLPEIKALTDCDEEQAHLDAARSEIAERRHALEREQKRLEDEVALFQDRRNVENERLYSGAVTAMKDLQALQAELEVLGKRQSDLEEQVLEVMERAEPVDQELADVDAKVDELIERRVRVEASLAESQAAIDAEVTTETAARAVAVAAVDADLVRQYEQAREDCGGVGIAKLNVKTCEGCHLQLAAVAFDRIRKEPAGSIIHCPECERILVRG